jgi:hypothetical protein
MIAEKVFGAVRIDSVIPKRNTSAVQACCPVSATDVAGIDKCSTANSAKTIDNQQLRLAGCCIQT